MTDDRPFRSWRKRFSRVRKRLGLAEFFEKYPTYGDASDKIFATLAQRQQQRDEFWRNRFEAILNENRLQGLSDRFQKVRDNLVQTLLARAEPLVERLFPTVDQAAIDKRIANYVNKLLGAFQQFSKRNTEQWKAIFKAIDDASKGEQNKWFRTLVADIDSADFAAKADAESTKMFQKLEASSKLFINNIQQFSHRITKQQKNIRERVKNAIRHIPKVRRINDRHRSIFTERKCLGGVERHELRIVVPHRPSTGQLRWHQ